MSDVPGHPPAPVGDDPSDHPRLHIDELLEQLMSRAGEVVAARDGLRKLLTANGAILGELSLPAVLRRVVESACELTGARFGALGVIGADGTLEQFIHVGMDAEIAESIGPLPKGKGLLGALIAHPEPITLRNLGTDPRSSGFPPNHPPMNSFLGVPIRLRDEVYGNLYLTESASGEFTGEQSELAVSLAGTAAIAIENARLFRDSQRRQDWLEASTEITQRLLTRPFENALGDIADQVLVMADADVVIVVLPIEDGARLRIEVATGQHADELTGRVYARGRTLSQAAIDTGQPIRIASAAGAQDLRVHMSDVMPIGPVIALPLTGSGAPPRGALLAGRLAGRTAFSLAELDMAATFAGHAAVALELADARAANDRLALLEDRDRIARDLHDHVIQRLFAAGLTVQSVLSGPPGAGTERLNRVIEDLDDTIRQIRTSIFALQTNRGTADARVQLLATLDDIAPSLKTPPHIRFLGPIDSVVTADLLDDVQAVLREALSNAARHAGADLVQVDLAVADGRLTLQVKDNGIGIGRPSRRSGLGNMHTRAERRGGRFDAEPASPGTIVTWSVPLPPAGPDTMQTSGDR